MNDEIGFRDAIAHLYNFDVTIGLAADTLVAVLTEDERFAVFELQDLLAPCVFFSKTSPCSVIEDVAVLKNLDECGSAVHGGGLQGIFQVSLENIHGASDESRFRAYGQGDRVERAIG